MSWAEAKLALLLGGDGHMFKAVLRFWTFRLQRLAPGRTNTLKANELRVQPDAW